MDLDAISQANALRNASASFAELEERPTSVPLEFDAPIIGEAVTIDTAQVYNPGTGLNLVVTNIVYERHADGSLPARAYWMREQGRPTIFGWVRVCTILSSRNDINVPWEVTEEMAAVKVLSLERMQNIRHPVDPSNEVAALQYMTRRGNHPNVVSVLDVLQDDESLFVFMPYLSSGDLGHFVWRAGGFPEPVAMYWFDQILEGLLHLQRMGICHRDISLENVMIDSFTRSALIDFGLCLRVPYHDEATGGVTDVTQGSLRRLIQPSGSVGRIRYMAPEILRNQESFDGFAVDLWGAAVVLFIMLVGRPPWQVPTREDAGYRMVALWDGTTEQIGILQDTGVSRLVRSFGREISPLAADLLQKMLREDPRQRLSLAEVRNHPWLLGDAVEAGEIAPPDAWRVTQGQPQRS